MSKHDEGTSFGGEAGRVTAVIDRETALAMLRFRKMVERESSSRSSPIVARFVELMRLLDVYGQRARETTATFEPFARAIDGMSDEQFSSLMSPAAGVTPDQQLESCRQGLLTLAETLHQARRHLLARHHRLGGSMQ
jgi:hypothetical protein